MSSWGWNIGYISFVQTKNISAQDSSLGGVCFNPFGTKMITVGYANGGDAYEYDLSVAWDISTASHVDTLDVSGQDNNPLGLAFNPTGTKMYISGNQNDKVYEYTLTTGFDLSTASYVNSGSVTTNPYGLWIKSDGTKIYTADYTTSLCYEYDLSTPWDITSISLNDSWDPTEDTRPAAIALRPDGLKLYMIGNDNDNLYEYNLSTPWDITTTSYVQSYDLSGIGWYFIGGLFFNSSGERLWITHVTGTVSEYELSEVQVHSQGNYAVLPIGKDDLESGFTADDYIAVSIDNESRAPQLADGEFSITQFKDKIGQQTSVEIIWNGQTTRAPSSSTVYLQIFNVSSNLWETIDSDNSSSANIDFTLSATVPQSGQVITDYLESGNWLSCRVYQEAV